MITSKENKYIFYRNDQHQVYSEFDPTDPTCLDEFGYKYFGRVLNLLEPRVRNQGLVFCVTSWTVHELPVYGDNVIACIMQDEWSREVGYREKVGMVLRTCGLTPFNAHVFKDGNLYEKISNFLAQGRALKEDNGRRLRSFLKRVTRNALAPVVEIPIGYYSFDNTRYIPIEERNIDIYFAGSFQHKKVRIKRPKEFARQRMGSELKKLSELQPELIIDSTITGSFAQSIKTDNSSYLEKMMNTKLAPIPRGANLETYRFFEAIRFGAIPIGETFPKNWFYDNAPIVRLKSWSEFSDTAIYLLSDNEKLKKMHEDVLRWWERYCSENALANYIALQLEENSLLDTKLNTNQRKYMSSAITNKLTDYSR